MRGDYSSTTVESTTENSRTRSGSGSLAAKVGRPRAAYAVTGVLGLLAAVTIWWGAWELRTQRPVAPTVAVDAVGVLGEQGAHAPGGVLEAAEEYAQV